MEQANPTSSASAKALPGAWQLIVDSWKIFITTWTTSIRTTSLFIYVGVTYFIGNLIVYLNSSLSWVDSVLILLCTIATIWISIRVNLSLLRLEAGQEPMPSAEESSKAWPLFLPLIWVGILTGLVVIGASLLLILPGIYFGVALAFTQLILIDQGVRGTQALAASRTLVKGRWWATLWRLIVGSIVSSAFIGIVAFVILMVLNLFIGTAGLANQGGSISILVYGIVQLLQMTVLAATVQFVTFFHIKLYRALQRAK